ncbi:MAG TPA: hypothetical protein VMU67_17250 [Steroidobacteraceae bacterium]|nr:hypothetical protein [Steroidobacteraceae bacterium]
MPAIPDGPEERAPAALDLPCAPPDKRVIERVGEPVPEQGEFRLLEGRPCILFAGWDYAEDWSGAFVAVIPPESLQGAPALSAEEFWRRVRDAQSAQCADQ